MPDGREAAALAGWRENAVVRMADALGVPVEMLAGTPGTSWADYRDAVTRELEEIMERAGAQKPCADIPCPPVVPSLGQVAYEAYIDYSGGKSLVTGEMLPSWADQELTRQQAWQFAAQKVARHIAGLP